MVEKLHSQLQTAAPENRAVFFMDLDWISFSLQPDPEPDYPNEINCDHRKS